MADYPIETILDSKFVKVFDLQYEPGRHYFTATRRTREDLAAIRDEAAFRNMIPDAVSLCVVWHAEGKPDRILLNREYRPPLGRVVTSVPAGLIDPEDRQKEREAAIRVTAERELYEETGIRMAERDRMQILNPCLFSSPGLTDESNAMVRIDLYGHAESERTQSHAEGTEIFDGFQMLTREEARKLMVSESISVYTWIGLAAFANE